MIEVTMHDGTNINVDIQGKGQALLLPVNPKPAEGAQAEELKKWGVDPSLGKTLIDGLKDRYRVIAFDYEGHVILNPKPDSLTPEQLSNDFLAIADRAGAERFAYYGYSWLALAGLQLALRTNRLSALIMGGFPPIGGPYREMLKVTTATYAMATANQGTYGPSYSPEQADEFDWSTVEVTMSEAQTKQFVTLYESLQSFDDSAIQHLLRCPRLCFAGSADRIEYGEKWGDVTVDIAGPLLKTRGRLIEAGWDVALLDGLDHTSAMQPVNVLPLIRPWLDSKPTAG
ncbi:alpha/beta fold hydrolase [Paenibacillus ginsengarvi]|uniref:Alpha/beta hydrolase n=1 Tax=Paenibacillus ginsengarvi TaxID=400777 RepID=A0A3B0CQI6_9BACL|nr:alpha/beta hydrolase [Paenibacillus ginsengarvi]RKN86611.1 alpha/beta hydrolase [Paenibacillus ginsengarvi]